ncbi:MAG: serine/threonine protein kinase, partial [Planctomycetaceae bacterium]|nr:serine/threonine protein kinase [Planctomycetaceae bacterium]
AVSHAIQARLAGQTIGPYELIEEIGEGGMGMVFLAEQKSPVRRQVAIKIIKPGMDRHLLVARFEAERHALALMDHPGIARVLDAGTTEQGGPYFVMELVWGIPITEYCDRNRLTIPERLELFVCVCQSVQHAHQKQIVHRDLKPCHVLIALHEGVPVPKIIDFGIAEITTRPGSNDKTVPTTSSQFLGTPLYMSPEQTMAGSEGIDARSDIYALGVMLYELLSGRTPIDQDRLRDAGYEELLRAIRKEVPPEPSARILALGAAAEAVASKLQTTPGGLTRMLQDELDWIVMRALAKDRTRRYQTAGDLVGDIQRYLAGRKGRHSAVDPLPYQLPGAVDARNARIARWSAPNHNACPFSSWMLLRREDAVGQLTGRGQGASEAGPFHSRIGVDTRSSDFCGWQT